MSKLIVLQSSDGESFELPEAVALLSKTLEHLIADDSADNAIPIPNVTAKILAKVIQYCKFLAEVQARSSSSAEGEKVAWRKEDDDFEAEFMKVDQNTLFDLILAANYLEVPDLLDITCGTVANMIKGKSPQQIRETFNINNDFTPEEEAEVLRENAWAFTAILMLDRYMRLDLHD